jgi:ABC-type antimicrobial peptide transport system permease subunit
MLARVDPAIAMRSVTLERQIGDAMLQERLMSRLSSLFGAMALVLAAVGLYGVVAYTVTSRRGEIAVRVALGATRTRVLGTVLADVGAMLAVGIAGGSIVALLAARSVQSLLYGLEADDPVTLLTAAALLGAAGLLAAVGPARRAAGVDPAATLREA